MVCTFDFGILFDIFSLEGWVLRSTMIVASFANFYPDFRRQENICTFNRNYKTVIVEGIDFCSITFWVTDFIGL
jgi:hypothetical protein